MAHKFYVLLGLLVITATFADVIYQGYKYRKSKDPENKYGTGRDEHQLSIHRHATNLALIWIPAGILLIEMGVQLRPAGSSASSMLWVHLPFAIAFVSIFLVLRFWLTGLRSVYHSTLGRAWAASYAGTLSTGTLLIWQM